MIFDFLFSERDTLWAQQGLKQMQVTDLVTGGGQTKIGWCERELKIEQVASNHQVMDRLLAKVYEWLTVQNAGKPI